MFFHVPPLSVAKMGTFRASEGSSSSASQDIDSPHLSEKEEEMKRAAVKKRIERYFYQLLEGCGNSGCGNRFCASSGKVPALTPDQAAARALQLFAEEAKLCTSVQPSKMPRTEDSRYTLHFVLTNFVSRCVCEMYKIRILGME